MSLRRRLEALEAYAEPARRVTPAEGARARARLAELMARDLAAAEAGDTEAAERLERVCAALKGITSARAVEP